MGQHIALDVARGLHFLHKPGVSTLEPRSSRPRCSSWGRHVAWHAVDPALAVLGPDLVMPHAQKARQWRVCTVCSTFRGMAMLR